MIDPSWQEALTAAVERRRINLAHRGEILTLSLLGTSTGAIVLTPHKGRDLRPGDIVWVKEVTPDGRTVPDDSLQFFPEGLPGLTRGTERVAMIEEAKGVFLAHSATDLSTSLLDLLEAGSDAELGPLFDPTLALLELFITARPETAERLRKENPRKVREMLNRCLTLRDVTGRRNPHSKVLGVKSSQKRLRSMSARRMATANMALTTSLTLNALMRAMDGLVAEVHAEIESKLNADTWDMNNLMHRRWLKRFGNKLAAWANEFVNVDMHPFARGAKDAEHHLRQAGAMILNNVESNVLQIKHELQHVLIAVKGLLARFQVAEMLRVVGTARDERVQKLGLKVSEPVWEQIDTQIREVQRVLLLTNSVHFRLQSDEEGRIQQAYSTLRGIAAVHDKYARTAAA